MKLPGDALLLLGSLLVVGALYNHYMGHSAYLVEIIFIVVGLTLALYSVLKREPAKDVPNDGLLIVFFSRFVSKQRLVLLLPFAGFVVILAWSVWKLFAVGSADLRMEDFIVTLFGLSLVLYYSGPSRFAMQKDFVVLYLMFMTIVFAVIWKIYTMATGESYSRITAYSEYYFITIPVVSLVNLFGVDASSELDLSGVGISNMITYEYHGKSLLLGIGTGCSGLYSAGLFFSAFLAFVLVRYRTVDRKILLALGLGLVVTWASNIIRMVITILVGSMYGHPALAFVHSYIGVIIFIVFAAVFWTLIVLWLDRVEEDTGPARLQEESAATAR